MTTTLTVIALVTRLRITQTVVYGDAIYREKLTSQNHTIGIKQFVNVRHEYNETFAEGDLLLFGGKFTLEGQKVMVRIRNSRY